MKGILIDNLVEIMQAGLNEHVEIRGKFKLFNRGADWDLLFSKEGKADIRGFGTNDNEKRYQVEFDDNHKIYLVQREPLSYRVESPHSDNHISIPIQPEPLLFEISDIHSIRY